MTRTLTKPERGVLACVPASTKAAFSESGRIRQAAVAKCGYQPATVDILWNRLKSDGLIDEQHGHCKRTREGDAALEPQLQEVTP